MTPPLLGVFDLKGTSKEKLKTKHQESQSCCYSSQPIQHYNHFVWSDYWPFQVCLTSMSIFTPTISTSHYPVPTTKLPDPPFTSCVLFILSLVLGIPCSLPPVHSSTLIYFPGEGIVHISLGTLRSVHSCLVETLVQRYGA